MSSKSENVDKKKPEDVKTNESAGDEAVPEVTKELPELEETYLGGDYSSATIKELRKNPEQISKLFKEGKYPYTDRIQRNTY